MNMGYVVLKWSAKYPHKVESTEYKVERCKKLKILKSGDLDEVKVQCRKYFPLRSMRGIPLQMVQNLSFRIRFLFNTLARFAAQCLPLEGELKREGF
jgi:hypothetical protein